MLVCILQSLLSCIYFIFRPVIKVILRHITKLCELQRICYGTLPGALRTIQIEFSLNHSKRPEIKGIIRYMDTLSEQRKLSKIIKTALNESVTKVIVCKNINPHIHNQFIKSLSRCLEHIWGYKQVVHEIKLLAKTQFDSEDKHHEEKLLKLWSCLMPGTILENRISRQWQDIGFQGDDPKTDFRGMGILGLDNLLFFAKEYPSVASSVLSHSMHPTFGYAFAIVGINITNMAYNFFIKGYAKTHVYNVTHSLPSIQVFHHFYCYLYYEFDKFWIKSKPASIMDFAMIRGYFEQYIEKSLSDPNVAFRIKVPVDTV